jgi:hypothetical protein
VDKAGYVNRVGEFAFDVFSALKSNFASSLKDETAQVILSCCLLVAKKHNRVLFGKASLQSAWTTGVARIVVGTLKKV